MGQKLDTRLATFAYPVDDLVDLVRRGEIRIPSFQRGLRWGRSDVISLFDSIVRGYPIGNLLLWKRSAAAVPDLRIGALEIDAPSYDQALYVVDGQQRLTSLSNALTDQGHEDPRFALSYDTETDEFVPRQLAREVAHEIPLPVIFDLSRLLAWYADHPELTARPEHVARSNNVAKAIREFRVPVYVVEQSDLNVLTDIFDRMNNYGKQLTRAEVFSALHQTAGTESTSHSGMTDLAAIARNVHAATGFGVVDENTILLATLARRGSDVSRDIRREFSSSTTDFPAESAAEAQEMTERALIAAVSFLQEDAKTPHFAFLPYRYLLVVLARFFAHFPSPSFASRRNLRRWFWRAASLGPDLTRGNITATTRSLCARITPEREAESVGDLLQFVSSQPPSMPRMGEFRTNWADTRLLLAAMWDNHPRDLADGHIFSAAELLAALGEGSTAIHQTVQLFRSASLPTAVRSIAGNRLLLASSETGVPEDPAGVLRASLTGLQFRDMTETLESHFINEECAELLLREEIPRFIESRQRTLASALESFLKRQAEWSYEDTPSLRDLEVPEEGGDDDFQ